MPIKRSDIVHKIRNSCKYVPYKDRKAVCADLKKIYSAVNLDEAEFAKEEFREKWDNKYPNILKSWDKNWAELTVFFECSQEIRKIIYTTNAAESYHRMVRKFTISKSIFPTDNDPPHCQVNKAKNKKILRNIQKKSVQIVQAAVFLLMKRGIPSQ